MTKIHLILNKKALIGGLLKIITFLFFFGINLVPKYCSNLMYYEHFSKKDFYDILGSVMGSKMIKKHLILEKMYGGGVVPLKLILFFLPFFEKNKGFTEHFGTMFIKIG